MLYGEVVVQNSDRLTVYAWVGVIQVDYFNSIVIIMDDFGRP